jgi:hypothetical protein
MSAFGAVGAAQLFFFFTCWLALHFLPIPRLIGSFPGLPVPSMLDIPVMVSETKRLNIS